MSTFKIEQTDSQCVVIWRHFSGRMFFMFLFFTSACIALTYRTFIERNFIEQELFIIYITLVFWGVWIVLFLPMGVNMLFGKTRLVLDESKFQSMTTYFFLKSTEQFDLTAIHQFMPDFNNAFCLSVDLYDKTSEGGFYFTPASETEVDVLCDQLNAFLDALKIGGGQNVPLGT